LYGNENVIMKSAALKVQLPTEEIEAGFYNVA